MLACSMGTSYAPAQRHGKIPNPIPEEVTSHNNMSKDKHVYSEERNLPEFSGGRTPLQKEGRKSKKNLKKSFKKPKKNLQKIRVSPAGDFYFFFFLFYKITR